MVEEGWKMKYEIATGLFSLARASYFRYVSKTVSTPEDLGCRCDWRNHRSRCGILDALRKFHRKIFDCAGLFIW
jgi:hypothetical protein